MKSVSKLTKENGQCVNRLKVAKVISLRTLHEISLRALREILLVKYLKHGKGEKVIEGRFLWASRKKP
jgi:hypothetical protein